ncbi:MAG: PorT family protein [Dysgonamonadaceae bacterium]|jgi:hypothetical protein|nr:PorT family protein [Dysgonamonadaceae bacterium]
MKDKNNTLEQQIRDKLNNYSVQPGEQVWDKIESRLASKPRRNALWFWISGAAAAVLAFLLLLPVNKENEVQTAAPIAQTPQVPAKQEAEKPVEIVGKNVFTAQLSDKEAKTAKKAIEKSIENRAEPAINPAQEEILAENIAENKQEKAAEPAAEAEKTQQKQQYALPRPKDPFGDEPIAVKKPKKRTAIGFLASSGNNSSANSQLAAPAADMVLVSNEYYGAKGLVTLAALPDYQTIKGVIENNFEESDHSINPPMTFGLTFRKMLSRRNSIETGLIYTFVSEDYSKGGADWMQDATVKSHYIGIPLNLRTIIKESAKKTWNIYCGAGGKVERGLTSSLSMRYKNDYGAEQKTKIKENLDNFRFAANASIGFEYRFHSNYALFFEPYAAYYFGADSKLNFGIGGGLSYLW